MTGTGRIATDAIDVRRIGTEQQPLVIMENALANPDAWVRMAGQASFQSPPGGYYPGLNAPIAPSLVSPLVDRLRGVVEQVFGLPATQGVQLMGYLALATAPARTLQPIQRVPHYDAVDKAQLAILCYLCEPKHGGTGFYRHDRTGFETIDATRQARFRAERDADYEKLKTNQHVGPWTEGYTLVEAVPADLNRLIIYRSNALHSGLLTDETLSADPRTGRLTLNIFIRPPPPRNTT